MGNQSSSGGGAKGSKKSVQVFDQDRAVLDLKIARDNLKRFEKKNEKEAEKLFAKAKELYAKGQKQRALYTMKVRKLKTAKVAELQGQLLTIERTVGSVEWASQSAVVFDAMEKANAALRAMHELLPLERVEELMDEAAESAAYQEEIDGVLATQGGTPGFIADDDAALNAELDQMAAVLERQEQQQQQQQQAGQQQPVAPARSMAAGAASNAVGELPAAPQREPVILPAAPTSPVQLPFPQQQQQQQQQQEEEEGLEPAHLVAS